MRKFTEETSCSIIIAAKVDSERNDTSEFAYEWVVRL